MNQNSSLQHIAPELRVFSGARSLDFLSRELERSGCNRAAVFCGETVSRSPIALPLLRQVLGPRLVGEFPGIRAQSPLATVREAVTFLSDSKADAVIALGGGSAAVTARAASIILAEGLGIESLCSRRQENGQLLSPKLMAPKLPQFMIPTTPTTACVKAGSAILDPNSGTRFSMFDPKTRAKAIFIHPQMLGLAPYELVQSACLNALAMAVEGLESARSDPLADALLMHSVRLIGEHLPCLRQEQSVSDHREQLTFAAIMCGRGTDIAGGGLASVLGHAVGPRAHAANGIVNAIVLPYTMRYNAVKTGDRLSKVAAALSDLALADGGAASSAILAVETLLDKLIIPRRLRDLELRHEELPLVASCAMDDWFIQFNPRPVTEASDVLSVLEAAW